MEIRFYFVEDNSGRCVAITNGTSWIYNSAVPSGFFGDVDLYGEPEKVIEQLRVQNGNDLDELFADAFEEASCREEWDTRGWYFAPAPTEEEFGEYIFIRRL